MTSISRRVGVGVGETGEWDGDGDWRKKMIKKQYFKEMNSRIKSIVGVFLTIGVAQVNIYSFWVATLTWASGDALRKFWLSFL
jgi:hypothetical protein